MSDESTLVQCYVLWAYLSDRSGAKLLGVYGDMVVITQILRAQQEAGSLYQLQVRKMTLGQIDPQDIFP
jgi:hypothetical protein